MNDYTLHGLAPNHVAEAANAEHLAELLRDAHARRLALVPWGGGTRQHVGRRPARYDLALSTRRLNQIVDYQPAERLITVEAGMTLGAVQAQLAHHGQWLPWDPAQPERATIGGLLASGATGALRLSHGSPRDWTLGMRVALGDGRLVRSSRHQVQNSAGFDTHRVHIGALGTLGVITEVTFRVAVLPERRQSLLAAFTNPHLPARAIDQLRDAPLQPLALVVLNQRAEQCITALHAFLRNQPAHIVVLARFAGASGAVKHQLREAVRRCVEIGARTVELHEEDDQALWNELAGALAPHADGSLLLKARAPSNAFGTVAGLLERTARQHGWDAAQIGIAGVGLIYSRWATAGARPETVAMTLAGLRAELALLNGYAVVEEAPPALAGNLDVWGPPPEGIELMRSLRARWDPAGILNPGRYVV